MMSAPSSLLAAQILRGTYPGRSIGRTSDFDSENGRSNRPWGTISFIKEF